jgi:hypothetical protein
MDEKELYSIFSKALFPSGNINIEDIINVVTKENKKKPEEENKVIIDSPKPYDNIEPKKYAFKTGFVLKYSCIGNIYISVFILS